MNLMQMEKELKILTTLSGYRTFLRFQDSQLGLLKQENFYFDTEKLSLYHNRSTLRIRCENSLHKVCLKVRQVNKRESKYVSSSEYEKAICEAEFRKCLIEPRSILNVIPEEASQYLGETLILNNLQCLGSIQNERRILEILGRRAELDYSVFPSGTVSYEIEFEGIETESQVTSILEYLASIDVEFEINTVGKYQRFIADVVDRKRGG